MSREDEPFLGRWSRLKRQTGSGETALPRAGDAGPPATPPAAHAGTASADTAAPPSGDRPDAEAGNLAEVAAIDIDALDATSDFAPFMRDGVPDALRNRALRKLWSSDPVFATLDGLDDCCGDYTDAACASGLVETAYKVGRGFLTDDEVAAWERLGRPEAEDAHTAAEPTQAQAPEMVSSSSTAVAEAPAVDSGDGPPSSAIAELQPGADDPDAHQGTPVPPPPTSQS